MNSTKQLHLLRCSGRLCISQRSLSQNHSAGQKTIGFIKNIREDGKIDVSLQPLGYRNTIDGDKEKILAKLKSNGGTIQITDKSSPESIKFHMQMSKKAFKRAVGALYKERKIVILSDRIQKRN